MITQYGVQCFDAYGAGPQGPMIDAKRSVVMVLVFAKSEEQAIGKAKKYVERREYRVVHIQEFKNPHDEIDDLRKQPWEKDEE